MSYQHPTCPALGRRRSSVHFDTADDNLPIPGPAQANPFGQPGESNQPVFSDPWTDESVTITSPVQTTQPVQPVRSRPARLSVVDAYNAPRPLPIPPENQRVQALRTPDEVYMSTKKRASADSLPSYPYRELANRGRSMSQPHPPSIRTFSRVSSS